MLLRMNNPLHVISPVDGRYSEYTKDLASIFSEAGLMRFRVLVESEYLIALSELRSTDLRKFSKKEKELVRSLYAVPFKDAQIIHEIESVGYKHIKATNHDVKAVEYYMAEKLAHTSLRDCVSWLHFALTSEDTNNLAYGIMMSAGLEQTLIPMLKKISVALHGFAKMYADVPMLSRTHGQPATPTTFGKEWRVFAKRVDRGLRTLEAFQISVKLNGATGNYNAHVAAYPKIDWMKFTARFVKTLNTISASSLEPNFFTTQIESHDSYAELFDILRHVNTILIGLNQDIWRYISDGWIIQRSIEGEVGSSTMPHKVNPIRFENSEGNLGVANALCSHFSNKLPISRLQRDLSDSTVERNFGVAFAHSLIGYAYLLQGLGQIEVHSGEALRTLQNHPEVIAEAIQTILRREGASLPYEKLKELTRGKKLTLQDLHSFISALHVSRKVKKELLAITPENYLGIASKLAKL